MPPSPKVKTQQIALKLLLYVIIFSSIITLVISVVQLAINYKDDISKINQQFAGIKSAHLASLSSHVWVADSSEIDRQLRGIITTPNMLYAEIIEKGNIISSAGVKQTKNFITKEYPLVFIYKNTSQRIGTFVVQATLNNVYQHLIDLSITILVSNAIKTFLVSTFILFLFHRLVTRHLHQMALFIQQVNVDNLDNKLELEYKNTKINQKDELTILVNGINSMQQNLSVAINQLQEQERKYRRLVESSIAIPWELDLTTNCFSYVGPQAVEILGYEPNDWYKKHFWLDHIFPDDKQANQALRLEKIKLQKDHSVEYRMFNASGEIVWVRDDINVICKDGIATQLQGYIFDITDRKLAELMLEEYQNNLEETIKRRTSELENTNSELESFSYSVSHDLRSPLRAISGFSQILQEDYKDLLDDEASEYLQRVINGCQKMSELIDALLTLSRVSRRSVSIIKVDLSQLCENAIKLEQEISPQRDINISIQPNMIVRGDKSMLEVLINNLVSNAWKFTGRTNKATISFGQFEKEGKTIFYVKDNGAGFDSKFSQKLFSPFQRLHTDEEFSGTGIGLATILRIVKRHNGTVYAESELNKGATFFFTINRPTDTKVV